MNEVVIDQISVCVDCMVLHANGEYDHDRDPSEPEPLSLIGPGYSVTMGVSEHSEHCTEVDREEGCDCDQLGFSWSRCEGCGSTLGGDRFALTLWRD
jgi:hypothetical protein